MLPRVSRALSCSLAPLAQRVGGGGGAAERLPIVVARLRHDGTYCIPLPSGPRVPHRGGVGMAHGRWPWREWDGGMGSAWGGGIGVPPMPMRWRGCAGGGCYSAGGPCICNSLYTLAGGPRSARGCTSAAPRGSHRGGAAPSSVAMASVRVCHCVLLCATRCVLLCGVWCVWCVCICVEQARSAASPLAYRVSLVMAAVAAARDGTPVRLVEGLAGGLGGRGLRICRVGTLTTPSVH